MKNKKEKRVITSVGDGIVHSGVVRDRITHRAVRW
jgi:hypothetical protein